MNRLLTVIMAVSAMVISQQSIAQCGELVWAEEFDGTSVNESDWTFREGNGCNEGNCGFGNNEVQYYAKEAIEVEDGKLVITASKAGNTYKSGSIWTKGKKNWKYGKFEMRAKMPTGTGAWPAFWLLPEVSNWPSTGEIDIMEYRGDHRSTVGGTLHYGPSWPDNQHDGTSYSLSGTTFDDDFHTFTLEWEEGAMRWFVDGELFKEETKSPNTLSPASGNDPWPWDAGDWYIIINLAVGGPDTWYTGRQPTDLPAGGTTYEIDYIRVYAPGQPHAEITGREKVFEGETLNYGVVKKTGWQLDWQSTDLMELDTDSSFKTSTYTAQGLGPATVALNITVDDDSDCSGRTLTYTKNVEIIPNNCELIVKDFDGNNFASYGWYPGELSTVANQWKDGNPSANTAKYVRNSWEEWDVIILEDVPLNDGALFAAGELTVSMDMFTNAPVGTAIDIQLINKARNSGWPSGVHSLYTATTTKQNEWETLDFVFQYHPDGTFEDWNLELDRITMLFDPGNKTGHTYYFDNLKQTRIGMTELLLTGSEEVAANAAGELYNADGGATTGDYKWYIPDEAEIIGESNGASINVDFGDIGGTVEVKQMTEAGCYGPPAKLNVTVGGDMAISHQSAFTWKVYPTVFDQNLNLETQSNLELTLMDLAGRIHFKGQATPGTNQFSMAFLSTGAYILHAGNTAVKVIKR